MNLNQIDTTTLTGKLLIITLVELSTCAKYFYATPDEVSDAMIKLYKLK